MKLIALLDCNNFFVSCERLFRPDLKNRPVVVLSSNDGCVVARSAEIKDIGIPMGVPYFQIKDIMSDIGAVAFSSNFTLYRDISRRVFDTVRTVYPNIEQYSIDECFFEIEDYCTLDRITELKNLIETEVGVPVSIGVAKTKTLAKLANARAKKTKSPYVMFDTDWQSSRTETRLSEIWGVGKGRELKFSQDGLKTVSDLLNLPKSVVAHRYGLEGARLYDELSGLVCYPVTPGKSLPKSVTSSRSFRKEITVLAELEESLFYHLEQCLLDLFKQALAAKRAVIYITPSRYSDWAFQGSQAEIVLPQATGDIFSWQKQIKLNLEKIYRRGVPYKKAGVVLSDLAPVGLTTSVLPGLGGEELTKQQQLTEVLFKVNKGSNKNSLSLGRLVKNNQKFWQPKTDSLSPAYTTKWTEIKRVKVE
jgi:DNA polymerase V